MMFPIIHSTRDTYIKYSHVLGKEDLSSIKSFTRKVNLERKEGKEGGKSGGGRQREKKEKRRKEAQRTGHVLWGLKELGSNPGTETNNISFCFSCLIYKICTTSLTVCGCSEN